MPRHRDIWISDFRPAAAGQTDLMPVHLYGQVCDMDGIMAVAHKRDLKVVEDCAQCYLGAHNGRIGGTIGDVGSWSFENAKNQKDETEMRSQADALEKTIRYFS